MLVLSRYSFLLAFLLASCTTSFSKKKSHKHDAPVSAASGDANAAPIEGEVAYTEEEEPEEGEEESDVADTEPVDGTPTDLGDVEASDKIRDEEMAADILARKSFPLVNNEFVEQWLRYFTGRGRIHFEKWLSRSPRYMPLITKVMAQDGLPEDLVFLAMIESGFNPRAKSHARAVGPWQFIKSTGTRYSLRVDSWVDERRDIVKSTHAAAQYLKELHQIFGSWYLAAASYNAGEGKVLNAIRRDKSRNFWELARKKKNFRSETRNYVPKIIAAALISKNPAQYGFADVKYETNLEWEVVEVPAGIHLKSLTDVLGIEADTLKLMNAELKRGVTPPGQNWDLKVPVGRKAQVVASLDKLRSKKYKIVEEEPSRRRGRGRGGRVARSSSKVAEPVGPGAYRVQPGDTLWDLSRKTGVSVAEIKRLNQIRSPRDLRAGLVIKVPSSKVD